MPANEEPSSNINDAYKARTDAIQTAVQQLHEALVKGGLNHEAVAPALTILSSAVIALTEIASAQVHLTGIAYSEEQRIKEAAAKEREEKVNPKRNYIGKPR